MDDTNEFMSDVGSLSARLRLDLFFQKFHVATAELKSKIGSLVRAIIFEYARQ